MSNRAPRLTNAEIDALLVASGDIDPTGTFEDDEKAFEAWESGRNKLAIMLRLRQEHRDKGKTSA